MKQLTDDQRREAVRSEAMESIATADSFVVFVVSNNADKKYYEVKTVSAVTHLGHSDGIVTAMANEVKELTTKVNEAIKELE